MIVQIDKKRQAAMAETLAKLLGQSRRRLGLSQAALAARTNGLISKPAITSYETGGRSMRVDTFWALAKTLGEDPGEMLSTAERISGSIDKSVSSMPVVIDVDEVGKSKDPGLAPIRRWVQLHISLATGQLPIKTITLTGSSLVALADVVGLSPAECLTVLAQVAPNKMAAEHQEPDARCHSQPVATSEGVPLHGKMPRAALSETAR